MLGPMPLKILFYCVVIPEKSVATSANGLNFPLSINLGFSSLFSLSSAYICYLLNNKKSMKYIQFLYHWLMRHLHFGTVWTNFISK